MTKSLNDLLGKPPLDAPERKAMCLYRVQQQNKDWLISESKKRDYKDTATFLDDILEALRMKATVNDRKKKTQGSSKKTVKKRKVRT